MAYLLKISAEIAEGVALPTLCVIRFLWLMAGCVGTSVYAAQDRVKARTLKRRLLSARGFPCSLLIPRKGTR
jgi:hypothetical protein